MRENSKEAERVERQTIEDALSSQRNAWDKLFVNVGLSMPIENVDSVTHPLPIEDQA